MERMGESNLEVAAAVPGHAEGCRVSFLLQNCVGGGLSQPY